MLCRICGWTVEMDDIVLRFPSGRVICSRCFHHEVADEAPVSLTVRRQINTEEDGLRTATIAPDAEIAALQEQQP
jgi:hypothetical protein